MVRIIFTLRFLIFNTFFILAESQTFIHGTYFAYIDMLRASTGFHAGIMILFMFLERVIATVKLKNYEKTSASARVIAFALPFAIFCAFMHTYFIYYSRFRMMIFDRYNR